MTPPTIPSTDWASYIRFHGLPPSFEYIDGVRWKLRLDIAYRIESGPLARMLSTCRSGFVTDFASTSIARGIFPSAGDGRNLYGIAALWHDWLYQYGKCNGVLVTRREVDDLFLEIMLYLEVNKAVAYTMWGFVRACGWGPWLRYRRQDKR